MLLRGSRYVGDVGFADVIELADEGRRHRDPNGYRAGFVTMVQQARRVLVVPTIMP
jgi:hypothetical protein